jgi:hypothetical protein
MHRLKEIGLILTLLAISAAPRLPGLGRFTTLDEPFWLRQSANFYYALGQRDFANTIYEYHPAVTTMWIIAAGFLLYFPEYRALEQGYLKPGKFELFLPQHGKDQLELLIVSRAVQVAIVLLLLVAVYLLLRTLFDRRSSFFATALVSVSPFLVGQSRVLNHDAMLALFSLISLLGLLAYLHWKRRFVLLLASAVAAGLAQLTKSSGMPIVPLVVLVLTVQTLAAQEPRLAERLKDAGRTLGMWLIIAAASYIIFWPGMWVAPAKMLQEVYGNALSYTIQGARLSVLPGLDAGAFGLGALARGLRVYGTDLIWRTTPITWAGAALGIGLAVHYTRSKNELVFRLVTLYCLLLAAGFVLLFSIQRGPTPPHYILTSHVSLNLLAGLALVRGWRMITERFPRLASHSIASVALCLILALQLASSAAFFPYYISYYNPIMEAIRPGIQNPTLNGTGYGVGLDQAAAYLAKKPNAGDLTVMSANGAGSFSYYFPGTTVPMNYMVMSDPELMDILSQSQYAVVDYYNQKRNDTAQDLAAVEPEKTIWINGLEFLHIYRASDLLAAADHTAP